MPFATGFRARRLIAVPLCMAAIAALAQTARADETFPNRPVRFLIPFAAAGSNDVVARILAHQLTDIWKQQVVADNRAGANGIIGIDMVAKAPADGYTLLIASTTFTMNPSLYKLPFDPVKDFAPVTLIAEGPLMLCSHPGFAARDVGQLIALAKAKPGQLQYASSGLGGIAHLACVLLEKMAGISLLHVPYKGSGAGVIDAVSGQVPLIISSVSPVLPFVKNGRLRVLGIGGLKRSKFLPDVPTIAESGVPGYESNMWWGHHGAGTHAEAGGAKAQPRHSPGGRCGRHSAAVCRSGDGGARFGARGVGQNRECRHPQVVRHHQGREARRGRRAVSYVACSMPGICAS